MKHSTLRRRLAGSWSVISRRPNAWWMACLFGISSLIGVRVHITKPLMHLFRGHIGGMRKCSVNVDKRRKRPPLGGKVGEKRRGDQSGQRNKLPRLFCALRPGMKSLCGREPENPAWWREDWPKAHKLFEAWPWPPVQGGGRTRRWPPKWPDDVAHARDRAAPALQDAVCPPSVSSFTWRPCGGRGTTVTSESAS